jgi:hypothetical protein
MAASRDTVEAVLEAVQRHVSELQLCRIVRPVGRARWSAGFGCSA